MSKVEMMKDAMEGHKYAPSLRDEQGRMSVAFYKSMGYEIFTPGPLYVHAMLDRSVVEGFRDQRPGGPKSIEYSVWAFDRAIVRDCQGWSNLLCVMDKGNFQQMLHWMTSLQLIDKQRNLLHLPSPEQAAILDPFLLDEFEEKVPTAITAICPICQRWHIRPTEWKGVEKEAAPETILLSSTQPPADAAARINELMETLKA